MGIGEREKRSRRVSENAKAKRQKAWSPDVEQFYARLVTN